jgi:tRNA1Val (adenine37-N6)-methyltransferase
MKVSTDACIQGAWVPVADNVQYILDIGAGTGLLSLMLAQRTAAHVQIDALELDADAAMQAGENIAHSPWKDRVHVIAADARTYVFDKKYQLIVCNPPFFNNSLLGPDDNRNSVRHTLSLSYHDLFNIINNVLDVNGTAAVLLPAAEHATWEGIVKAHGWSFSRILQVYPKSGGAYNRVISICCREAADTTTEILQIYADRGTYTPAFTALLEPYYLKL